jgi:hypothetical protein
VHGLGTIEPSHYYYQSDCQHTPYEKLPYFYPDQHDPGMEYKGYATDWDRVVIRGDLAGRKFLAFWFVGPPGRPSRRNHGSHVTRSSPRSTITV